jgi:nucleoside-diphosphate-sugar epimerase
MPFEKKMEDAIWKNKNALAKQLLGWEPKTAFRDGLKKTMEWYFATKQREEVRDVIEKMLTAR